MNRTEVRGSLREMWDTRPSRPRDGRKLGGVALAIARRYDIDPVIVRVAFAVTAFYGVGLFLYLIGMVVLPVSGDDPEDRSRPRVLAALGLAVLGMVAAVWALNARGAGFLVGLTVLGLLFLLHRSRGSATPPTPQADAAPATVSLVKGAPTPPSWDPLGAAPFAWDLPEPGQAPPPPPERPRPVTAVTSALALLAGAVTTLLILTTGTLSPSSVPIVLGVVLAVLGLGLLIGSFLHAGRGLVPLAVVVGLITWGAVAAPLDDGDLVEYRATPATVAALAPSYQQPSGSFELDLSELDLTTGAAPVRTSVGLGAGEVLIRVPDDADVTFTGTAGFGEVSFAGQDSEGPGAELRVTDLGEDDVRSGRPLEISVEIGAGDVEVRRG